MAWGVVCDWQPSLKTGHMNLGRTSLLAGEMHIVCFYINCIKWEEVLRGKIGKIGRSYNKNELNLGAGEMAQ